MDAAIAGSSLKLPACTSTETLIVARPLDIDARGTLIDGAGALEHAVIVEADDVAITGLSVRNVAGPPQDGAVRAWDVDRFVFRDGTIEDSAGACISVARGVDAMIVGTTLMRCGQEGIHATRADRLLIRDNRINGNNPQRSFDPEWEAGGAKVTESSNVVFEGNDVWGNGGPGIWCDIDCRDLDVHDNRVWANDRAGIQVEISNGAIVKDNTVWENGWDKSAWGWGAGILVSSSRAVTVESNVLAWNADGIVVVSQDREDAPSPINGNRTTGNFVASETGNDAFGLAWLLDWSGDLFDAGAGSGGSSDRFWFDRPESTAARFAWAGSISAIDAFSATPGGTGAAYTTEAEMTALLRDRGVPEQPSPVRARSRPSPLDLVPPVLSLLAAAILAAAVGTLWYRRHRQLPAPIADADSAQQMNEPRELP